MTLWKTCALIFLFIIAHTPARGNVFQSSDFDKLSALATKTSDLLEKFSLTNTDKIEKGNTVGGDGNIDLVQWILCVSQLRSSILDVAAAIQIASAEIAISQKMKAPDDEAAALNFVKIGLSDFDIGLPKWRSVALEARNYCETDVAFKANVDDFLKLLDKIEATTTPMRARVSLTR